ncbi:hypothetical protein ACFFOM_04080 [Microlunatus capsulatus]|uniref:Aminoglycoside phosphotransferase domain-containing protein n=1 Tax=Microlunatus capsulatus TaxID=99117 RepID=A0ABS4Z213_9ACTN|nr:hypothetical protein [Microlunatus capsulatus]MBP2415088.1 hypothetical protein [Microlunatus capsulatus]
MGSQPEDLSPAPLPSPRPGPLPFGLTWSDLVDVLPAGAVRRRAAESHVKRGEHQGGHPSVITTLSYEAPAGHPRRTTLFFKRNPHEAREGERHRFLARRGVPVPRLAVCVEREHEEVLGLELLPTIGVARADVDDLLRLTAALNAVTDVPPAIARTRPGQPQDTFERLLARALDRVGALHAEHAGAPWLDTYRRALPVHRGLPRALTHGELAVQQVGRTEDGMLVVLDLATLAERARFADIANLLAAPGLTAAPTDRALFVAYLGHLAGPGRVPSPVEDAWTELQLTRFVQGVEALPWHVGPGRDAELRERLRTLAADHRAVLGLLGA